MLAQPGGYYCNYSPYAEQFCNAIPKNSSGGFDYYSGGSAKPWVIGQNTVVNLKAGTYTPGVWSVLNVPAIFLFGNAKLNMVNVGYGLNNEVRLSGWVFLCDNAQMNIINSTWRIEPSFDYQFNYYAAGHSRILFQDAMAVSVPASAAANTPGHFGLFWARSYSSIIMRKGKNGFGLTTPSYRQFGSDAL